MVFRSSVPSGVEPAPGSLLHDCGANPIPALLERASKNVVVTGFVEDLNREIACSEIFVAPLVSGGGFKNKVLEAIANSRAWSLLQLRWSFPSQSPVPSHGCRLTRIWRKRLWRCGEIQQKAEAQAETLHETRDGSIWLGERGGQALPTRTKRLLLRSRAGGLPEVNEGFGASGVHTRKSVAHRYLR